MFVTCPTEENPMFQEWAYYMWMSEATNEYKYTEIIQSIERIIKHQYDTNNVIIGMMIHMYNNMIYEDA
jgi:hypothetical protein